MKKWFDIHLFRDAMKQLRVGGMVSALVLLLQAVLLPIGRIVSQGRTDDRMVVTFIDIFPSGLLLFCAIAPLMALFLFRFLSQRNACDFYHSIPQTRTCLYVSFIAAVLCWAFLLQAAGSLVGTILHLIFPRHFEVIIPGVLTGNLRLAVCTFLVVGAVMLAVTLTGNILTNLAVSLLIIFFPRLVMLTVRNCVGDSLTIVSGTYLPFLGSGWNLVTDTVFAVFEGGGRENILGGNGMISAAYTAGLGLFYMVLGGYMFSRRKSEAAGEASVNPYLQAFFRLLPAAVVCLIPNMQLFSLFAGSAELNSAAVYMLFVLYLAGVFIYFMYELASTRKVKNLVRAVPGLAFLFGFNLLMVFGMLGLRHNLLAFTPDAAQIDSVQIVRRNSYMWASDGNYYTIPGYLSSQEEKIELTDINVKQLVAARLKETVEYDMIPAGDREDRDYCVREFVIHSGGKAHHRVIQLLNADVQLLAKALQDNPEVQSIYMNLPEADEVSLSMESWSYTGTDFFGDSGQEYLEKIYNALKEDIADMGFEKWYAYCQEGRGEDFTLFMKVRGENGTTGSSFPIGEDTPKARQACVENIWTLQQADRERMLMELKALSACQELADEETVITFNDIWLYVYPTGAEREAVPYYMDVTRRSQTEALIGLLEKFKDTKPKPGEGFMTLNINVEYSVDGPGENDSGEAFLLANGTDAFRSVYGVLLLPAVEEEDLRSFHNVSG